MKKSMIILVLLLFIAPTLHAVDYSKDNVPEGFHYDVSWQSMFGDVMDFKTGSLIKYFLRLKANHPNGGERTNASDINSVRFLLRNSKPSIEIISKSVANDVGVTCLFSTGELCGVSVEKYNESLKSLSINSKDYLKLQQRIFSAFNKYPDFYMNMFYEDWQYYVVKNKVRLPAPPYEELFQFVGALEGLDSHSSFVSRKSHQSMIGVGGVAYVGIGIVITNVNEKLAVIDVLNDGGAQKAGILTGDEIISIAGVPCDDQRFKVNNQFNINKLAPLLLGKPESKVEITVKRGGAIQLYDVERSSVQSDNTIYKNLNDAHYVYFHSFTERSFPLFRKKLDFVEQDLSAKPLVFDLRGNGGGAVSALKKVLKYLTRAPGIKLFYSRSGVGPVDDTDYLTLGDDSDEFTKPILLLIDHTTASSAEALAANLKHLNRALVLGDTSFGKGSLQAEFPLPFTEAYMKITDTLFYTANGFSPQYVGVTPHIKALSVPHDRSYLNFLHREEDTANPIEAVDDIESKPYVMSDKIKIKVDCAEAINRVLLAKYLEKAKTMLYPGDYTKKLALEVAKNCY